MTEVAKDTIEFLVTSRDMLIELLRQGAQEMLATAIGSGGRRVDRPA
jgi:hypothetical protein